MNPPFKKITKILTFTSASNYELCYFCIWIVGTNFWNQN